MQQYVEDTSSTRGALEEEYERPQQEDTGMDEFVLDDSFEEWTASFIGRESLGCGRRMITKEVEVRNDYEESSPGVEVDDELNTAEGVHSGTVSLIEDPSHLRVTEPGGGDSRAGVGDQDEAQASQCPDMVSDETTRPTAAHPRDTADDR